MRADLKGLFWEDQPKSTEKRTPPARTWDRPDYLPHYAEAVAFDVPYFGADTLARAAAANEVLVLDTECAPNYFLVAFRSVQSGRVAHFEMREQRDNHTQPMWPRTVEWILENFQTVGFNSNTYDMPLIAMALAGYNCEAIKDASDRIINAGEPGWAVLRDLRVQMPQCNHVDLIEVAPLSASLKIYGGRLHVPRMQDLPFDPRKPLSAAQITVARWYCINTDLPTTAFMYIALKEQLELRAHLSVRYGIDLRSKSDAQVAEAVIRSHIEHLSGHRISAPDIEYGKIHKYTPPPWMHFHTEQMQHVLAQVCATDFEVADNGTIPLPESVEALHITMGRGTYQMGVGGLHSTEQRRAFVADGFSIRDIDVSSYYPKIILNTGLYPQHLGQHFTQVYKELVDQRLDAKARGDKAQAESLKIAVNGTYGKLSSPYSFLYAPEVGMHVTLTGQLALLMLIERLELAGISVISGNTDGIVALVEMNLKVDHEFKSIITQWEKLTGFETEESHYAFIGSRDVNNYIAIKTDGTTKNKGAFANPWAHTDDAKQAILRFHKNPVNTICIEAVEQFLIKGTPLITTIRASDDPRKFVTVRTVKGGAVKDGEYLGRAVRWYYAKGEKGEMVYALSGNKVPRTDGAKPLMDLPATLPADIDLEWYEREAQSLLVDIGAAPELEKFP